MTTRVLDRDDYGNNNPYSYPQAELQEKGVTHDLLVIEGGGHGFRDPQRRARATEAMVAWFKEHLDP